MQCSLRCGILRTDSGTNRSSCLSVRVTPHLGNLEGTMLPLGFVIRLLIVLTAVEVAADLIGLTALVATMDPNLKWWILIGVLLFTLAADLGLLGYLLWVTPAAPGAAPAPNTMSRASIKAGLYSGTMALIATLVAIFLLVTAIGGYLFTMWAIGLFLVVILIMDISASVALLRR